MTWQASAAPAPNHCLSRPRMCACASPACPGVAVLPVPIAHTGSAAATSRATWLGREAVEAAPDLSIEHGERLSALALFQRFADADDGCQVGQERGHHL